MENSNQVNENLSFIKEFPSILESSFLSSFISPSMTSFEKIIKDIKKIFEKEIKPLITKFSIDLYETKSRDIRNLIIKLRKLYYRPQNEKKELNQSKVPTQAQTSNQQVLNTNTNNISSFNQNNVNTNNNSRSNSNKNTNYNSDINGNKNKEELMTFPNVSFNSQIGKEIPFNNEEEGIMFITYNLISEIANFLMSYDDIYINYENKSAFFTMKLFLEMATLRFIRKIDKSDFILCLMNKSCNILCKYNDMQKEDNNIKHILTLEDKELEKLKTLFEFDLELIKHIQKKILKKKNTIDDTILKGQKITEELNNNNLFNKERREIKIIPEDKIQMKIDEIKKEINIINDIQNSLGQNYKLFLKDPILKELEQFNLLVNKISEYKSPLIRQKFIDIIIRNKEVFNYINDNILIPHISKNDKQNLNLYPLNKNMSIFADKYVITGKTIFQVLSIPLEQDYSYIMENATEFAKKFFNTLKKGIVKNENEDNLKDKIIQKDEDNKDKKDNNTLLFKYDINYYHLLLFSFMVSSKMKDKNYFTRISALITTDMKFSELNLILDNIEDIKTYPKPINKDKENESGSMILFDYENINKQTISFLLEKKNDSKKDNKIPTNLEICSVLSKKLFNEPINIILTIALKYWAIQRKLFKYDFIIRKNQYIMDDPILLYFIHYFLMHKGLIEPYNDILKDIIKESQDKKEDKKENIKKDKNEEKKEKNKKDDKKEIERNKDIFFNEKSILLKQLGELFIEFFWFIHELIKLTEEERNKDKTISIDLSTKNYISKELIMKEFEATNNRPSYQIPVLLELCFGKYILHNIYQKQANILKKECTRALYFLLNKDGEELFVMKKYQ